MAKSMAKRGNKKQEKIIRDLRILGKRYREKGKTTDLGNPKDTLMATVLSAQTTDAQVLRIFPALKKRYSTFEKLAQARVSDLEKSIKSIGFYKTKSRRLKELARDILARFNGRVPKTMEELITLPGVGRKTASIVLSFCFDTPAIAVDTHVHRIVRRLGWTKSDTPERIEQDLKKILPEQYWSKINHTLVPFGRDICKARKPECWRCPLLRDCPYEPKTPNPKEKESV